MATSKLTCPSCDATLKLAQALAPGKKLRCPKCKDVITVPDEEGQVEEDSPLPRRQASKSRPSEVTREKRPSSEKVPARHKQREPEDVEDEDFEEDRKPSRKSAKGQKKKGKKKSLNPYVLWGSVGGGAAVVLVVVILFVTGVFGGGGGDSKDGGSSNGNPLAPYKATATLKHELIGHQGEYVCALAFSPDGKYLAVGDMGKTVKLWQVDRGTEIWTIRVSDLIADVEFNPDNRTLITTSGPLRLRNITNGQPERAAEIRDDVLFVSFTPDGKLLAAARISDPLSNRGGGVDIYNANTLQLIRSMTRQKGYTEGVAISPDGKTVAEVLYHDRKDSVAHKAEVVFYDASSGTPVRSVKATRTIFKPLFHPKGKFLAAILSGDRNEKYQIVFWDPNTGNEVRTLIGHEGSIMDLAFSKDGTMLLSGGADKTARLWDVATGHQVGTLTHTHPIASVAFSPDGKTVAVGGGNARQVTELKLWEVTLSQ